jgi:hypothetical protein
MAGEDPIRVIQVKTKNSGWRLALQNKIFQLNNRINKTTFIFPTIILITFLLILGCAGRSGYTKLEKSGRFGGVSLVQNDFDSLWNSRTITIFPQQGGSFGFPPIMPGRGMGRPTGGGMFELIIRATLMDSSLIESGINQYAQLIGMTPAEKKEYQDRYEQDHYRGQYLYIWARVMTPFSEGYLNLNRWTFFLETESGHQLEPEKVIEQKVLPRMRMTEFSPDTTRENIPSPFPRNRRSAPFKIVQFYFPLKDYDSIPLLGGKYNTLKFGAVNVANLEDKAEASWDLNQLKSEK